ncbi:MAG: 1-acyl-sn-glycerol-3-phosphate acyltransferase [Planctomycetes bacterium]|nr:1-acyl-sn-glycerol-3-phosphate acyltransferase [Planctomycetota bacterium]
MFRATITAFCMSLLVVAFGFPLLIIGFIHPSSRLLALLSSLWAVAVLYLSGVRLTVDGFEDVADRTPRFYVANHQSALDIPILLLSLKGDVRFFAKNTLFRIPIFGWVLARYGYVPIDRGNARQTLRSVDRVLSNLSGRPVSIAVFPEGTRSRDGRLQPFRKGTMKICQRSGMEIVPVTIDGSINVHHRDSFRATPGSVRVTFHPPIPTIEAQSLSSTELLDRIVQTISRQLCKDHETALASHDFLSKAEVA